MAGPILSVSPNGEYLALSTVDGTLKIWDSSTGSLRQEYVPSSHLSSTCTCLSWSPKLSVSMTPADGGMTGTPGPGSSRKKKKRKSTGSGETCEIVVLGTTTGNLLLYNTIRGDIHANLTEGHSDKVNSVSWVEDGSCFYSGSDDRYITEWSLSESASSRKWKADENPVECVSVLNDSKHLLSASREIKLWNLESKEVLKVFTGHSTVIHWLIPVGCQDINKSTQSQNYFLSATTDERHINVWQTSSPNTKSALASFLLDEEPAYIHMAPPKQDGCPFLLLVTTKGGVLHIFIHTLNGRLKKPLKSKLSVQIVSDSSSGDGKPRRIPLLSGCVCDDTNSDDRQILLTFGSSLRPVFEKVSYGSLEKDTVLVRADPSSVRLSKGDSVSKEKPMEIPTDVNVLTPGRMMPSAPSLASDDKTATKRKKGQQKDLTMAERVNAIGEDKPERKGKQSLPKTDTLCTLLAQGLQSQDKKMLNHVLQHTDITLIHNTVKKLPVPVIVPLVTELSKRMMGHAQSGQLLIRWVKAVLTLHTSYLMSFPELIESFSSLYQMMENRVKAFGQLSRLQGKLNLMMSQVNAKSQSDEDEHGKASGHQALLLYRDESSDDEMEIEQDDLIPDSSESEDNWEELSDLDAHQNGGADDVDEDDIDDV